MPADTTRWNLVVPTKVDRALRQFLAAQGRGKKGDLSAFVVEAVNKQVFENALQTVRENNKDVPFEEIEMAVEESLAWAREQMSHAGSTR